MTEREFWIILGQIGVTMEKGEEFSHTINRMINLLDQTDSEDFFGTEGWRHDFGWDY